MLHQIHENLWYCRQPYQIFGIDLGLVMTVMRVNRDRLVVHTPIELNPRLLDAIEAKGSVAWVIAANRLRRQFVSGFMDTFPDAVFCYPPGFDMRNLACQSKALSSFSRSPWPEIGFKPIVGMPMLNEYVFYHRPSKTLVCSDFISHVPETNALLPKAFWRLMGLPMGEAGQSRLFTACIRNKRAYNRSIRAVSHWPVERVMAHHGPYIEFDEKRLFDKLARQ